MAQTSKLVTPVGVGTVLVADLAGGPFINVYSESRIWRLQSSARQITTLASEVYAGNTEVQGVNADWHDGSEDTRLPQLLPGKTPRNLNCC